MRLFDSRHLDDGSPARLIQIECPEDFDRLMADLSVVSSSRREAGQALIETDDLLLAAVIDSWGPESLLEVGSGKAAVPLPLLLKGSCQVRGLYAGRQALDNAPAEAVPFLEAGNLLDLTRKYAAQGRLFDVVCGFGIWERLHPARLDALIAATAELASPEALFIHVIPAVGPDGVFGEAFPSRLAENRAHLEAGQPFAFLEAENGNPPLPPGRASDPGPERLVGGALRRPRPGALHGPGTRDPPSSRPLSRPRGPSLLHPASGHPPGSGAGALAAPPSPDRLPDLAAGPRPDMRGTHIRKPSGPDRARRGEGPLAGERPAGNNAGRLRGPPKPALAPGSVQASGPAAGRRAVPARPGQAAGHFRRARAQALDKRSDTT